MQRRMESCSISSSSQQTTSTGLHQVPTSPTNPLLNDLVLNSIFQTLFVSIENFANCRLVCRQWNKNAVSVLKEFNKQISFCHERRFKSFLSYMHGCQDVPFHRYLFEGFSLNIPIMESFFRTITVKSLDISIFSDRFPKLLVPVSSLRRILDAARATLESLRLSWPCYFYTPVTYPRLQPESLGTTCNKMYFLTEIKIYSYKCEVEKDFYVDLFQMSPNLQKLECDAEPSGSIVLTALLESTNIQKLISVKLLTWEPLDIHILVQFSHFKLSKLSLGLHLSQDVIKGEILTELLSTQKESLETLETGIFTHKDIGFPKLPALKSLKLTLPTTIEDNDHLYIDALFEKIQQMTPNLFRLEIENPNSNVVSAVCSIFDSIEELTIGFECLLNDFNIDAGLCGITKRQSNLLRGNDLFHLLPSPDKMKPSISELKNLRKLIFETNEVYDYKRISDITGYLELTQMPYLKQLQILNRRKHWISEDCSERIKKSCPFTVFTYS